MATASLRRPISMRWPSDQRCSTRRRRTSRCALSRASRCCRVGLRQRLAHTTTARSSNCTGPGGSCPTLLEGPDPYSVRLRREHGLADIELTDEQISRGLCRDTAGEHRRSPVKCIRPAGSLSPKTRKLRGDPCRIKMSVLGGAQVTGDRMFFGALNPQEHRFIAVAQPLGRDRTAGMEITSRRRIDGIGDLARR